jgi:hypothetical protein
MITLTGPMAAVLGLKITQPGIFVQLGFTSPLYLCDRASGTTRSWNALTWTVADLVVSDYSIEGGVVQKITLNLLDHNYAFTALLLAQTGADKIAKVWYFDSNATAAGDPVLIFDGLMDNPSGGSTRRVTIPCSSVNKMLPVGMLGHLIPSYMFMPEGANIPWGVTAVDPTRRRPGS